MEKTISIEQLVRENIRNLDPYRSARDQYKSGVLLDANENALGAPVDNDYNLHRYPSPRQELLRDKLAGFYGVRTENVFTGVGSDEAIDLLFRIFCEPGVDRILVTPPTYGMYKVTAHIHNVTVDEVQLDSDFQLDFSRITDAISEQHKLLFLCSPNNPTGNHFRREDIEKIIERFPGIVVLDEAYVEFSDRESFGSRIVDYPNLVVLRTMSKAFGLAGIRLGVALATEPVIEYFMNVKAPYNINKLTAHFASTALDHLDRVRFNVDKIKEERERLFAALRMLNFVEHVYQSDANFILFKIENAESICDRLADRNLIVRYRGDLPGCEKTIRVTVGTPEENDQFLSALKEVAS